MWPLALTYLLHSLVFAAAASALLRLKSLSAAVRHACFRLALLGPFVSVAISHSGSGRAEPTRAIAVPAAVSRAVASASSSSSSSRFWLLVALITALFLARYLIAALSLWRRLRLRTPCTDPRVLARLHGLGVRSKRTPILTESAALTGPLALGRSEICVPRGLLAELDASEVDAVLAHELAHLERRDALWFPAVGALEAASWFYPVNRQLCAGFRASAELACDERALELTRDPLGLARALVKVAERATAARQCAFAPSMGSAGEALLARVQRLTEMRSATSRSSPRKRGWLLASAALLAFGLGSVHVRSAVAEPVGAGTRDDLREQSQRMRELAEREAKASAELDALLALAEPGIEPSVRQIELEQELRHLRATQIWLVQSVVAPSASPR